jgi:hypothetical protein
MRLPPTTHSSCSLSLRCSSAPWAARPSRRTSTRCKASWTTLTPWLNSADLPTLLGQPFTLFDHLAFTPNGDGDDEDMTVGLSPGGEIVFRAWLRQRGLDPLVCSS